MSSIYNPNGAAPTYSVAGQQLFPIASSTNATPIKVTLQTPTTFGDQDTVEIQGHQTNTAANGVWTVSKIDSSNFFLNGSIGNGVGGATGTAQDFSIYPVLSVPGDGDLVNAANVNTPIEGSANAIPFLYRLTGAYRMINSYSVQFGNQAVSVNPSYGAITTASTTFVNATGQTALLFGAGFKPCLQVNDLLQYTGYWQWESGASHQSYTTLGFQKNGGSYSQVTNCASAFGNANSVSTATIDGSFQPGSANSFDFSIMILNIPGTSDTFTFFGGASLRVNHYRLNG
jgi:hypothetical protein